MKYESHHCCTASKSMFQLWLSYTTPSPLGPPRPNKHFPLQLLKSATHAGFQTIQALFKRLELLLCGCPLLRIRSLVQ
jgi:hypothetical protein